MYKELLIERWNPTFVDEYGDAYWFDEKNEPNRRGDQPALIYSDGTMEWYKNGREHRKGDKPAIMLCDGTLNWYKNGKLHRYGDSPAITCGDGRMRWFKNGIEYFPSKNQKK